MLSTIRIALVGTALLVGCGGSVDYGQAREEADASDTDGDAQHDADVSIEDASDVGLPDGKDAGTDEADAAPFDTPPDVFEVEPAPEASTDALDEKDAAVSCALPLADCDGLSANGCESNLSIDPENCGSCGTLCPGSGGCVCNAGKCMLSCPAGMTACPGGACGTCVNLATDPDNCGACGSVCISANGTPTCMNGLCFGCDGMPGTADCDNDCSNGFETNLNTDPANCGSCGHACAVAHGTPACSTGMCVIASCDSAWDDCDKSYANGCETDLANDPLHCGACNSQCAGASCGNKFISGLCPLSTCVAPFADCDGNPETCCEVDTSTDAGNCGECGHACGAGQSCGAGQCV
ncbi:MAG TPA: hypothetical protein PLS95_07205 [Thermoanaerobaculales bacterium]|nr:hypothetical protein [Thermoanaerobaculales bacterium]